MVTSNCFWNNTFNRGTWLYVYRGLRNIQKSRLAPTEHLHSTRVHDGKRRVMHTVVVRAMCVLLLASLVGEELAVQVRSEDTHTQSRRFVLCIGWALVVSVIAISGQCVQVGGETDLDMDSRANISA